MGDTDSSPVNLEDAKHALEAQTLKDQLERQAVQDAEDRTHIRPRVTTNLTLPIHESVPNRSWLAATAAGRRPNLSRQAYGYDHTRELRQDKVEKVSDRERDGGGRTRRHKSRRGKTNRRRSKTNRRRSKTNRRRRKH